MGIFCICLEGRASRICLWSTRRVKELHGLSNKKTRIADNQDGRDCAGSTFSVPGELEVGHIKFERLTRNQNSHRR